MVVISYINFQHRIIVCIRGYCHAIKLKMEIMHSWLILEESEVNHTELKEQHADYIGFSPRPSILHACFPTNCHTKAPSPSSSEQPYASYCCPGSAATSHNDTTIAAYHISANVSSVITSQHREQVGESISHHLSI